MSSPLRLEAERSLPDRLLEYDTKYKYHRDPLRDLHAWLFSAIMLTITVLFYASHTGIPWLGIPALSSHLSVSIVVHAAYLIPVVYSYFIHSLRGGIVTLILSLAIMLPETVFTTPPAIDSLLSIAAIAVIGSVVLAGTHYQIRQRDHLRVTLERLELAHKKLHAKARTVMEHENQLATIASFSAMITQSLDIPQVIETAIRMVREVMRVEVVLIFTLDENAGELRVTAYEGVDEGYVSAVDGMKVGQGFCGLVAQTGDPLVIENVSIDPIHGRPEAKEENLQAQLSVPLQSRGRIIGTLCVSTRSPRQFTHTEVELLTAIGNLIGIAMENSELCHERAIANAQLMSSERKYRNLFENAHDAIWVQNTSGTITAANYAAARLFGYSLSALIGSNIREFLSPESIASSKEVRNRLLSGRGSTQPYTQKIIKSDGSEAILMLTANLVSNNGKPDGLQFIGRDITKEVRMRENQEFYLRQITQAHEEERLRISRDLHDSAAQDLIGILHQLENFCQTDEHLPMPRLRSLWSFHERLKDVLQEIRQLSRDLRPSILDHLGLLPSVDWLIEQVKTEHKIVTRLKVCGTRRRFSPETEVTLFRIIQEALRNCARHADPTRVEVVVDFRDTETIVTVADNGKGFKLPESTGELSRVGKLGIDGMQTRAKLVGGRFNIQSEPGKGTTITVTIPA